MKKVIGRFAPTPSGYTHIGNLFCYLLSWLSAKKQNGSIVLRMEDLDTLRTSRFYADETMEDLLWLGLSWDFGPTRCEDDRIFYQSERTAVYEKYFHMLRQQNKIYPCFCSRSDVKNANAPHLSDGRVVYPRTCRFLTAEQQSTLSLLRRPAWRIAVQEETISFTDLLQGYYAQNMPQDCGDFPIRRSDDIFCYQLAVVVDDALMGVTEVVRASDLLSSTPQQIYLYRLLGFDAPKFIHIPTVLDSNGNRLAKRDGSLSLHELKSKYTQEEILGRLAYLAGLQQEVFPLSLDHVLELFSWDKIPKQNVCLPEKLF